MNDRTPVHRRAGTHLLVAMALLALLGGCATPNPEERFAPVERAARERLGKELPRPVNAGDLDAQLDRVDQRVTELLEAPLAAENAVQIALLNNRGLQASLQELGIAEADLVRVSRLPNPGFSFAKLKRGDEREIERTFTLDLARLIALPFAAPAEQRRFAAVQRRVTLDMLTLAAETRKAYYAAVAAAQSARYAADVQDAADTAAELARRMAQSGNFSKLQQAREQRFAADAALNVARAQQQEVAARERLTRLLGLWGDRIAFQLPERLPDLPAAAEERPDIEQQALAQRLDVEGARLQAEATASHLGLSRTTRLLNVLELGYEHNTSNLEPRQTGYEISIEIPLFDWGSARVAGAEAVYMQSVHRAAQVAVEARSEVREAYLRYRFAYDIARRYRDDVVPHARRVSEENLLRYNGMLIGVFELLADARAQIAAVNAAIEAQRDFWIAQADLGMAMVGKPLAAPLAVPAAAGGGAAPAH